MKHIFCDLSLFTFNNTFILPSSYFFVHLYRSQQYNLTCGESLFLLIHHRYKSACSKKIQFNQRFFFSRPSYFLTLALFKLGRYAHLTINQILVYGKILHLVCHIKSVKLNGISWDRGMQGGPEKRYNKRVTPPIAQIIIDI